MHEVRIKVVSQLLLGCGPLPTASLAVTGQYNRALVRWAGAVSHSSLPGTQWGGRSPLRISGAGPWTGGETLSSGAFIYLHNDLTYSILICFFFLHVSCPHFLCIWFFFVLLIWTFNHLHAKILSDCYDFSTWGKIRTLMHSLDGSFLSLFSHMLFSFVAPLSCVFLQLIHPN